MIRGKGPENWNFAIIVLIYKKKDSRDVEYFRTIALLLQIYKLLMRIPTNRLEQKFDSSLIGEQARFRKNYSTVEHLHTVHILVEKVINEHNLLYGEH